VSASTIDTQPRIVAEQAALPLCVDLDGTLIHSDMLHEGLCALVTDPRSLQILPQLFRGRAAFKEAVAARVPVEPELLPFNETLLAYLRAQKKAGRYLVLATAADRSVACAVAECVGLFDEVIASDGTDNLKGAAKARALVARFGPRGFCYAGNAHSDLAVWREAAAAIVVNAPSGVLARARSQGPVELTIDNRPAVFRELLKAARPHQWIKNVLVFVPILTAHALHDVSAWIAAALMFAAFCCTASGIYLINDMLDIRADRLHPRKRMRPFARGAIALPLGALAALALICAGVVLSQLVHVAWIIVLYALMSISYSLRLKELPLVDVFMLAALYTIRVFGGGEATHHRLSLWLLGFSSFLFLSLALLKRTAEMMSVAKSGNTKAARRGYDASDMPILQLFGIAAAFAASIVMALFVQSEANAEHYASPSVLWLTVPLLLFWACRMWMAGSRGNMHHDPIIYAARDRVSWVIGIAVVIVLVAAKSLIYLPK